MRASLNFTLPDDQSAFDAALVGRRALSALQDLDLHCIDVLENGGLSYEARAAIRQVWALIPAELIDV